MGQGWVGGLGGRIPPNLRSYDWSPNGWEKVGHLFSQKPKGNEAPSAGNPQNNTSEFDLKGPENANQKKLFIDSPIATPDVRPCLLYMLRVTYQYNPSSWFFSVTFW